MFHIVVYQSIFHRMQNCFYKLKSGLTCLPDRQIQLIRHGDTQQSGHKVYLGVTLKIRIENSRMLTAIKH